MDWEADANNFRHHNRQEKRPLALKYACIPRNKVLTFARTADLKRWETFFNRFCSGDDLAFPVHPFNEEASLLFNKADYSCPPRNRHPFVVRLSASRTVTLDLQKGIYAINKDLMNDGPNNIAIGIKLPTDHVFRGIYEPNKSQDFSKLAVRSIITSAYISATQKKRENQKERLYLKENFYIIPEVYMQSMDTADDGPAFLVRDLNVLDWEQNLYLPAFSAYTSPGQQIAHEGGAFSDQEVKSYWDQHLIKPVAQLCAHLLVNYGLVQYNPHAQQFLIEISKQTRQPTGFIYLRDLCDLDLAEEISSLLGTKNLLEEVASRAGVPWTPYGATEQSYRMHGIAADIIVSFYGFADPQKCFYAPISDEKFAQWELESWVIFDEALRNTLGALLPSSKSAFDEIPPFGSEHVKENPEDHVGSYFEADRRARLYMDILTSSSVVEDWEKFQAIQPTYEDFGF